MVTLLNGTEVPEPMIGVVMASINYLLEKSPIVVYELVMRCRDRNHKLFGRSGDDLKALSLLQADGQPHDYVQAIVLSAAQGEDLEMTFRWPVAK